VAKGVAGSGSGYTVMADVNLGHRSAQFRFLSVRVVAWSWPHLGVFAYPPLGVFPHVL